MNIYKNRSIIKYVIFFIVIFILPSILNEIFQSETRNRYVILIIFLLAVFSINEILQFRVKLHSLHIICIALIWFFLAPVFTPFNFMYTDFFLALVGIVVFLIYSQKICKNFTMLSEVQVSRVLYVTLLWFTIIAISSLIFHKLGIRLFGLLGLHFFPFAEPAHMVRFYGVFLITIMSTPIKLSAKIAFLIISSILSALFPSLSLLIYTIISGLFIILLKIKHLNVRSFFFLIFVIFLFFMPFFFEADYFLKRIQTPEYTNNTTTIFFWIGIEQAKLSLLETNFIGIGLQQLGNEPPNKFSHLLPINKSGGLVAAKLIAETGIFGIFMIVLYIITIFKSFKIIKNDSIGVHVKVATAIIIAVAPEIFLRGGGYFSGSILLLIASIIYLKTKNNVAIM
jgi:hypothetical protein